MKLRLELGWERWTGFREAGHEASLTAFHEASLTADLEADLVADLEVDLAADLEAEKWLNGIGLGTGA